MRNVHCVEISQDHFSYCLLKTAWPYMLLLLMDTYKLLIFDLDGTLIDSKKDIAFSVNLTLKSMGFPQWDEDRIASFVGHGIGYLLGNCMPSQAKDQKDQLASAKKIFLEHYENHLYDYTTIYPGVRQSLERLSHYKKTILTNKPERLSYLCLKGLGIASFFEQIIGGDTLPQRKPHPSGILQLKDYYKSQLNEILMIGDSTIDIETARNAGVAHAMVSYGFNNKEELLQTKPEILFDDFIQLTDWILRKR